jgi:hypothetical protein
MVIEFTLVFYCQILKRDTALATAAIYQSMFGLEDGTIPATFQVWYCQFFVRKSREFQLDSD